MFSIHSIISLVQFPDAKIAVSYTHLDVYKRQICDCPAAPCIAKDSYRHFKTSFVAEKGIRKDSLHFKLSIFHVLCYTIAKRFHTVWRSILLPEGS